VRGERQQVDAQRPDVHGDFADRLDGVGVKDRAVLVRDGGEIGDRLNRADFVVRVHHGHDRRLGRDGGRKRAGRDDAAGVDREERRGPAAACQRLDRIEDGLVLDRARDDMAAVPGGLGGFRGTPQGHVVRFGAPAGEHDVAGLRPDEFRHRGARFVEQRLRALSVVMHARRIAEPVAQRVHDGVDHLGGGGRRGVVIEVAAHGGIRPGSPNCTTLSKPQQRKD
jgi:hypothetical protein